MVIYKLDFIIIIIALTNLDIDGLSTAIPAVQWLAIQEINNNSHLLPNYTLALEGTVYLLPSGILLQIQYCHHST